MNNTSINSKEDHEKCRLDVFIVGCGIVGGCLIEQIKEQQNHLFTHSNIDIKVYGIANSSQFLIDDNGIDLDQWKDSLQATDDIYSLQRVIEMIEQQKLHNPVIIDCTGSRKVAMQYNDYFKHGIHVVTANKIANGESTEYYNKIRKTAISTDRRFQYETNIGAGLPVIEPLQKLLKSGDQLHRFEGILSGSLSYIFGELHKGLSLSEATIKAKKLGYTEPDPREDLNGMDVARKVLIIAREAGLNMDLSDISVASVLPEVYSKLPNVEAFMKKLPEIDEEISKRVNEAQTNNQVLRYVASINNEKCTVAIENIDKENPLYDIDDGENILAFYTRYYQPIPLVIRGYGAGPMVTAAGVFGDLLRIID